MRRYFFLKKESGSTGYIIISGSSRFKVKAAGAGKDGKERADRGRSPRSTTQLTLKVRGMIYGRRDATCLSLSRQTGFFGVSEVAAATFKVFMMEYFEVDKVKGIFPNIFNSRQNCGDWGVLWLGLTPPPLMSK